MRAFWVEGVQPQPNGFFEQGRRTRSGRSGPDPTNFFAFLFLFFFFFLSFEANGFARGLKLNEIEHYKLDESKGRCPRETFFVSW